MPLKRLILNIFIITILIGGFSYVFIGKDKKVAAAGLGLCIKNNYTVPITIDQIITIDSGYQCPEGYFLAPADFNLNLLRYPTSTNLWGTLNDLNNSTSAPTTTPSLPPDTTNPYGDLLDQLNGGGYTDPNTGNTTSFDPANGGYNNTNIPPTDYNNSYPTGTYPNGEGYPPGTYPSGGYPAGYDPYQVNPNYVNPTDPSLESGRFSTLDQADYKYCVILTSNMMLGSTDSNTGRSVSALQDYLYNRGFSDTPATGSFNNATVLAVKRFQYKNKIQADGIVKVDTRTLIQTLTCVKYPRISYEDKPIVPSRSTYKPKPATTIPKTTVKKPAVTIKPTTVKPVTSTTNTPIVPPPTTTSGTLSSVSGNMYLSKGNNPYFIYKTKSLKPFICITINNTDCSQSENYGLVVEGVIRNFFETVNFQDGWAFSLYNGTSWGNPGDKPKIYLKDSESSSAYSIYTVNVLN